MKRVLVCGGREWTDKEAIRKILSQFPKDTVIIHGDQGKVDPKTKKVISGADKMAGEVAEELGLTVLKFPAQWAKFGKGAGMVRNRQMLNEGKPTEVIAFHSDITKSKGTKNMIALASAARVPSKVFAG
jgi:hypothetical protein